MRARRTQLSYITRHSERSEMPANPSLSHFSKDILNVIASDMPKARPATWETLTLAMNGRSSSSAYLRDVSFPSKKADKMQQQQTHTGLQEATRWEDTGEYYRWR